MGRYFLEAQHNILVVDIDGEEVIGDPLMDSSIVIPSLNSITLPATLTTQTSKPGKYHLYYKLQEGIWETIGNRIIGAKGTKVDFLCYGFIFDIHSYSPHHQVRELELTLATEELISLVQAVTPDDLSTLAPSELKLSSNITRFNLVQDYLQDSLTTVKAWNAFFRLVFPAEYVPKGAKKLAFDSFEFSYDLINKIAVKLTTTKELGTDEHTIPALLKIIQNYGIDPESSKTQKYLHKQILGSLPTHLPQEPYYLLDDHLTLPQHIENQPDTPTPIFKIILDGQPKFLQVDRHSLEPIDHNGTVFLTQKAAESLNIERRIYNESGKTVGWDDQVPIVYVQNNPYSPQLFTDANSNRNIVNLYVRSRYLKEATPLPTIPDDNLIIKLIRSAIAKEYQPLVIRYHAQVIFGKTPPASILWMSSLATDKGGTGKSIITIDIISRVLGVAGTVIKPEDMQGAWGDTLVGSKCLSLEDLPNMGTREFDKLYAAIKGATSTALRKLNMKGSAFKTESVETSITGSSNERINLHPSDRRFICLEPAHRRGENEELTEEEAYEVEVWRRLDKGTHSEVLQEYVDYLLYVYNSFWDMPRDEEFRRLYRELFIEAPETKYRAKWIKGAQNNSEQVITNLNTPLALLDSIRLTSMNQDIIAELFTLVIATYSTKTGKTALPWNWFSELLPHIQSDKYSDTAYSKAQIQNMLKIEFTVNVGTNYTADWARKWKVSGYVLSLTPQEVEDYKEALILIQEHTDV